MAVLFFLPHSVLSSAFLCIGSEQKNAVQIRALCFCVTDKHRTLCVDANRIAFERRKLQNRDAESEKNSPGGSTASVPAAARFCAASVQTVGACVCVRVCVCEEACVVCCRVVFGVGSEDDFHTT